MTEQGIRLIVGLGNPGSEYARTRHNAGFWFVDELARKTGAFFRDERKFQGEVCRTRIGDSDVWLLKPSTYMNRSATPWWRLRSTTRSRPIRSSSFTTSLTCLPAA